ncbi:phage portal protein [Nonomuraea sediminis]|uniref:phage portal protein n=1 Tax=Nonomuraea sediminis TaxID=2835864 RepID=UPI001BDD68F4|nr:phage portal protein [Nonomuraea sediminis]
MALNLEPLEWLARLKRRHEGELPVLQALNDYYEGTQPLAYMHPELLLELGDRIQKVVINWPRLIVDAVEERLDVEGFRRSSDEEADGGLWEMWQANDLDEQSQIGHVDAMAMRRSFVTVGTNKDDKEFPLITVESPLQMHADIDPATRRVRAALRWWYDTEAALEGQVREQYATLLIPNSTIQYHFDGEWNVIDRDDHNLGMVAVVPIVNRPRLLEPLGVSELADVIPLSDAACKVATDMMIAAEYHAIPRRWVFGAKKEDFIGSDGKPASTWSQLMGRLWANELSPGEIQAGQFPESDLSNFHNTLNALARLVASISGLPPHYLGYSTENPASADGIRSSEARLVKRAERHQRPFGGSWERVMRLAERIRDGEWNPKSRSLETIWRDASTPTEAAKADAVVKKVQARIIDDEQAWEDLGYTSTQRDRMRKRKASAARALERAMAGDLAAVVGPKPGPDAQAHNGGNQPAAADGQLAGVTGGAAAAG